MNYLYTFLALFVGFLLPVQVGINAELARFVNSPLLAALVSFVVGALCLLASVVLLKVPLPAIGKFVAMPVWVWGGRSHRCRGGFGVHTSRTQNRNACPGRVTAGWPINRIGFNGPLWMVRFSHSKNE